MTETAGWIPDELPASAHARELADILSAPPTYAERRAMRRESAAEEARRQQAQEAADSAQARGFIARMRGETLPDVGDVLARDQQRGVPGADDRSRHRQAREILRAHGLEDVLTGGQSGVVLDANLGVLEPDRHVAQRSASEDDRQLARARREADEGRKFVDRIRRRHAGEVSRSAVAPVPAGCTRARYERNGFCGCANCFDFDAGARRSAAEADRLMALGYTWETAQYAATAHNAGMAVR